MIEVTKEEFYAHIESIGLDKEKDAIHASIAEPPRTIYKKNGDLVARVIWYDEKPKYEIKP